MRLFFTGLLAIICFSSCVQKRFLHNAAPVLNPMNKEKGELYAAAYYHDNVHWFSDVNLDSSNGSSNGLNLQGAWAFSNRFALAGAYNYLHQQQLYVGEYSGPFQKSMIRYNRNEFTLAVNWFRPGREKLGSVNILVGTTLGNVKMSDAGKLGGGGGYTRYFDARSYAVFIQPSLNVYFPRSTSALGFSTRFAMQQYGNIKTNYTDSERASYRLDETGWSPIAESGMKVSIGIKRTPLALDIQGNYILYHKARMHVRRTNFSAGIAYHFNRRKQH